MKGVMLFWKKGKLNPCYVVLYLVLIMVGNGSYE